MSRGLGDVYKRQVRSFWALRSLTLRRVRKDRRGGQNLQTGCGCDTCEGKQNRETDPGSGARTAVQLGKISARAEIVGSVHWAEMALLYSVVSLALAFLLP